MRGFKYAAAVAAITGLAGTITAKGIGLKLTSATAKALNAALGTKVFSAGLKLGTAGTVLRF